MIKRVLNKINNIDKNYLTLLFINLFIFMPFISKRFAYGHDTMYHIAQIDSLTEGIKALNFTKISSIIGNSFGYGSSIFYPKLPHYICVLINLILYKFNVIYSINIYYIIISILSSIFMYKLFILLTNNKKASLLTSITYITMPYYISEVFVRGALNEFLILLFIPIVFIGLINLINNNRKEFYIYFTIGYIGLINSHLVLTVYLTILIIIFLLINIKEYIKRIKDLIVSSIIILIYTLPNIVLLLQHKLTNYYVVFDPKLMNLSSKLVQKNGLSIINLLSPGGMSVYCFISIPILITFIIGIIYILKNNNKIFKGILLFTITSILLSLKIFPYNILPKLLLSIQFAFRNSCFIIFGVSIISGLGIHSLKNKTLDKIIYPLIIILLIISSFYINKSDFRDISKEESNYDIYAGIGWNREYLTKYTFNNMDYFMNRDNSIKTSSGEIEHLNTAFPSLKFKIKNIDKATIEIPRLYYLGYRVREKINNKYYNIDYKCNNKGFIEFDIKEDGIVEIDYIGTKAYNLFRVIRLLFSVYLIYILRKKRIQ